MSTEANNSDFRASLPRKRLQLMTTELKRRIVGTRLGNVGLHGRTIWQRLWCKPERASMLGHEEIAALLLPCLARSGHTFVDVGSHIGSVIAAVHRADPQVNIIAIEADPQKAKNLKRKWPELTIHCCAAGESNQLVAFFVNDVRSGFSSLRNANPTETRQITVEMRRLDDLVQDADFIKVDAEGAEIGVLRGAEKIIERSRSTIYFESSVGDPREWDQLFDWFDRMEYRVFVPNRVAHNGPSLTRDGFAESHWYPPRTNNYFAIADERCLEIRDRAREILKIST